MMRKLPLVFVTWLICLFLAALSSPTWSQRPGRLHYSTLFNPKTVTTVSGEVLRVFYAPSGSGADLCVQTLLKTPQGNITAVLAPKNYMEDKGLSIAPKDRVTVSGSMITIMNKPHILVTEITGDRTMKLREPSGRPAWAEGDDWHVH